MYRVELYAQVRRSVFVEGLSEREAAKRFGLARGTVRKMLRYATPPGYRRRQPAQRPKLDPFTGIVDQILIDDQERPKKQRHTAKRIFDRLRDEYDFTGGYTIVKDYVRDKKLGGQEMFVPLVHPPGDAQADFGEALVVIDGVQRKAHYLVVDLPHSDDAFVKAFPAETTEVFCEGHNAAFRHFGGVPRSILYDNTTLAVARILGDGRRKRTRVFSELQSHYLFSDRFGRPGKGNDKGKGKGGLPIRARCRGGAPSLRVGSDWLGCSQALSAVPHRATAAALGLDEVSAPAGSPGGANLRRGLFGTAGTRRGVMARSKLLLEAHLKALWLPTFLREYDKLAR